MKEIAAALVKAQKEFGPALKTSTNPHFRTKYADLSACIEAVIDGLNNNGIYLMQLTDEHPDGIKIQTVFVHESGEQMSSGWLFVPASKSDPQGFGSALTYARRYSIMTACAIAPEDDDANSATKQAHSPAPIKATPKPAAPPPVQPATVLPTPPQVVVPRKTDGSEGPWQIKVSADPGTSVDDWAVVVAESTVLGLEMAQSPDDVNTIFRVNRVVFDKLKSLDPTTYDMLLFQV